VSPEDVPLLLGDTGPAALWGAALAVSEPKTFAVNYGNGHTLLALLHGEEIHGLYEHHTGSLDRETMADHLVRFATGSLAAEEIRAAGGHGVWPVVAPMDLDQTLVVVTGPNRGRFTGLAPRELEAAPFGDMMLTGCYGLLQGYRARC
jgi:uncharacterized protein (DUF1786 family)